MNPLDFDSSLVDYYRNLSKRKSASPDGLESFGLDEQPLRVDERVQYAEEELRRIVQDHLGNSPELHELARQIARDGKDAYLAVENRDEKYLSANEDSLSSLEIVVRSDGSRPSFLIKNGYPDFTTSPKGDWEEILSIGRDEIKHAIAAVGRINDPSSSVGFAGTGFRIAKNLIATNRHVLQEIATKAADGAWTFNADTGIDFGHEYRATASIRPHSFQRVAFAASRDAGSPIDHSVLDMVLIQLVEDACEEAQVGVVKLDLREDWADAAATQVFTIGYPARPQLGAYSPTLLEQLFQVTYGFKRLAPGEVIFPQSGPQPWTLKHDATTLGGNSGSIVVNADRPQLGAAIHYGGTRKEPRANWAHVLGRTLEEKDAQSGRSLNDILAEFGIA